MDTDIYKKQKKLIKEFEIFGGHKENILEYLMEIGEKLAKFDNKYKIEENKIEGCLSEVWVCSIKKEDKLYFTGDSNTKITKGLLALLIEIYSGETIRSILKNDIFFLEQIGLKNLLGSQRSIGFGNMLKKFHNLAMNYKMNYKKLDSNK